MDDSKKRLVSILCLTGVVLGCGGYYAVGRDSISGDDHMKVVTPRSPRIVSIEMPAIDDRPRPPRQRVNDATAVEGKRRIQNPRIDRSKNDRRGKKHRKPVRVKKKPDTPMG